jgi:hypothetical protein
VPTIEESMQAKCQHCRASFETKTSRINRAAKIGAPLYCGRVCAGLARRLANPPTDEQRRAAKSAYDAKRREGPKRETILAKKREHYYANHDRLKAEHAEYRAAHMDRHVEYCRQPEYRAKKAIYDRKRRAEQDFGEFSEAALLLADVEREIAERASKYEIYLTNGTINKAQQRRRAL